MRGFKREYFSFGYFRTCFSSIIQHVAQCIHSLRTPPPLPLGATCIVHRLYHSTTKINAGHSPHSMWSQTNHQLEAVLCCHHIAARRKSNHVECCQPIISQLLCRELVGVTVSTEFWFGCIIRPAVNTEMSIDINKGIHLMCFFGMGLSYYAYVVEMTKEHDDNYVAMCDISEHMSCSKVFMSS